jgi:hypothetical protein
MTLTLLPSAPGVFIEWAKGNADLAAIHGGRVGTRLNSDTMPAIRVTRIGGAPMQEDFQDESELQVECWHTTDAEAEMFVRQVVAALPTVRGVKSYGRVYTFEVTSGPIWAPDDPQLSTLARYIITVRLLTTP